jgi:hypothetical protein
MMARFGLIYQALTLDRGATTVAIIVEPESSVKL